MMQELTKKTYTSYQKKNKSNYNFKLKLFIVLIFSFLILNIFSLKFNTSHAAVNMDNWEVDVNIKNDGNITVKEKWEVNYSSISTLFRTFENNLNIINTKVTRVSNNDIEQDLYKTETVQRTQTSENYHFGEMYGELEIAWGVSNPNNSSITKERYIIEYEIEDVAKRYLDTAELYYKFLESTNSMSAKSLKMNIRAEAGDLNVENSKIFGHGVQFGTIEFQDDGSVLASTTPLISESMFEVRILMPQEYLSQAEILSEEKEKEILIEEANFRGDENLEKKLKNSKIFNIFAKISSILLYASFIYAIYIRRQYFPNLKQSKKDKESKINDFEYYTEIPKELENLDLMKTVIFMEKNNIYFDKFFSAVILKLIYYKILEVEVIEKKGIFGKDKINFTLIHENFENSKNKEFLEKEDIYIYEIMRESSKDKINLEDKDFKKMLEKKGPSFMYKFTTYKEDKLKELQEEEKLYFEDQKIDKLMKKEMTIYIASVISAVLIGSIVYVILLPDVITANYSMFSLGLHVILGTILTVRSSLFYENGITTEGLQLKNETNAFYKQLKDNSYISDHDEKGIVIWEKILVLATLFGVSKKVLDEIKIRNPELYEGITLSNPGFGYVLLHNDLISSAISNSVSTSMSTGSGGGFSGGGGGGFGGGGAGGR